MRDAADFRTLMQKAITVAGAEVLKDKKLLGSLMEDLAPHMEQERNMMERTYSGELGVLLYRAYQAKPPQQESFFAEARNHLLYVERFQEEYCNEIMVFYEGALKGTIAADDDKAKQDEKTDILSYKEKGAALRQTAPAKAYDYYLKAAVAGDAESQFIVGYMHEFGEGMSKDPKKAALYYNAAAKQGYWAAQHNLSILYYNGNGVEKNYNSAFRLAYDAARQGKGESMNNLGVMYEFGRGVEKNLSEAAKWYRDAVSAGYKDAEKNLNRVRRKVEEQSGPKGASQ